MLHHRGDQACALDTVGLNLNCLDRYNMPQSGDVMVARASDPGADSGSWWASRESFVNFLKYRLWNGSRNQFAIDTSRMSRRLSWDGLDGTQPVEAVRFQGIGADGFFRALVSDAGACQLGSVVTSLAQTSHSVEQ